MGLFSVTKIFGATIRESANDGSDFTNPDADYRRLFLGEDGQLHVKDSSGTVTDIGASSGSVATDAIWDAAGDLVQGTGANTAAKLSAGTAGQVLRSAGAAAANTWAFPPGYELDYVQRTSDLSITATTEGTAHTVVTGASVTYDGSTIIEVEFWSPDCGAPDGAAGRALVILLYEDSTLLGRIGLLNGTSTSQQRAPIIGKMRRTPASGSKTHVVKAYVTVNSNAFVGAGAGGTGASVAAYMRITKV